MKRTIREIDKLQDFINYYMEGNMRRFLRKHKNQYFFELTYSHTLKKIKASNKKVYKELMRYDIYPNRLRDYLNIFITLDKHFAIGFNMRAFKELLEIEEEMIDIIQPYMQNLYNRRWALKSDRGKTGWLQPKEALKEQKARGFIHINDFENFDNKAAHIISNVDNAYYYPINIHSRQKGKTDTITCAHVFGSLHSVPGHTRIKMPMLEKSTTKFIL